MAGLRVAFLGDSILDCGHYNGRGLTPARLLLRNDDALFPAFAGKDLATAAKAEGVEVEVVELAADGARVGDLASQAARLDRADAAVVAAGGNDFLAAFGDPRALEAVSRELGQFLDNLAVRPAFVLNVYDPTCGDDARSFFPGDPATIRARFDAFNAAIAAEARRTGAIPVDLHAHFLRGDASWFTSVIEPSLRGASEVRACLLGPLLDWLRAAARPSTTD
jgi:hypothetical protein